ncbi:hypothetical protein BGW38_000295, partial [Lunasporangiospora selenospora]
MPQGRLLAVSRLSRSFSTTPRVSLAAPTAPAAAAIPTPPLATPFKTEAANGVASNVPRHPRVLVTGSLGQLGSGLVKELR